MLVGMFGVIITFVLLIVQTFRKKPKKNIFMGLCVSIICLFIGSSTYTPIENSQPATTNVEDPAIETSSSEDVRTISEKNAVKYPASPGKKLYGAEFKGMNYYFKGKLVEIKKLENLSGQFTDTYLIKNDQGYIMPIFPPYTISVNIGDDIEVWGPLSGDGYSSSDIGVANVVGVAGAMNASLINVNGELR